MSLLKGKTIIITGASRGIGKGIATTLAQNGANIAFTYSQALYKPLKPPASVTPSAI